MTVNTELLEQVMQHIEDHPEDHDQAAWIKRADCGTAACFAGWTVLLSPEWETFVYNDSELARRVGSGTAWSIGDAAEMALGLEGLDADSLFDAVNTRPMLKLMVKDLVNGEPLRDLWDYRNETLS